MLTFGLPIVVPSSYRTRDRCSWPTIVQGLPDNSDLHVWEGTSSGHVRRFNWVTQSAGLVT